MEEGSGLFCEYCQTIPQILSSATYHHSLPHHTTYQAFLKSAEECQLCNLILKSLQKYGDGTFDIHCGCSPHLKFHFKYIDGRQIDTISDAVLAFELFRDRGKQILWIMMAR